MGRTIEKQSRSSGHVKAHHPVDICVGQALKRRRNLVGLSQDRLGDLLGLTFQQVQKYEKGVNRIGFSRLFEICKILRVDPNYFFNAVPSDIHQTIENEIAARRRKINVPLDRLDNAEAVFQQADKVELEAMDMITLWSALPDEQSRALLEQILRYWTGKKKRPLSD